MTTVSRRDFFGMTTAGAALAAGARAYADSPAENLSSLTKGVQPIGAQEHAARIAKLQSLMQQRKLAALLVEAGASLEYFTGIRWRRSERTTAALVPATGGVVIVTPFFEEPSIRELLKISADVRPWQEDESPFDLIAGALREPAVAKGPLAVEATTRFFIIDQVKKVWGAGREVVSGDDLVRSCRMIKSPAELTLMQSANDVTLAALKHVHGRIEAGMRGPDIMKMMVAATEAGPKLFTPLAASIDRPI